MTSSLVGSEMCIRDSHVTACRLLLDGFRTRHSSRAPPHPAHTRPIVAPHPPHHKAAKTRIKRESRLSTLDMFAVIPCHTDHSLH
eukprot:9817749-Prorocentrum_lima.AAC.1